jgi:tRNA threonylcarbamoyl adenosine modification protein YeaZ
MRILALDSSGLVASVAVVEEDNLLAEYTVHYKKTHSQTLLPMLDEIVRMVELDLNTVDAIAVAAGPGSFTGLRIGSATAKGLAQALDKPIISVPTLEGLAYQFYGTSDVICPLMDARRNQTYTGLYRFVGEQMECIEPQCAVPIEEILQKVNELGQSVLFLGDGVAVFREAIGRLVTVPYRFAPAHLSRQRAGAVGALAIELAKQGKLESAAEHKPDYLRLSQAERERMEKEQHADS